MEHIKLYQEFLENNDITRALFRLNLSVISGEYLLKYDSFIKIINTPIKNQIKKIDTIKLEKSEKSFEEEQTDKISEKFKEVIKKSVEFYKQLAENINDNSTIIIGTELDTESINRHFYTSKKLSLKAEIENSFNDENSTESTLFSLFLINLNIADFDEYFESSDEFFNIVSEFLAYLNRIETDKYSSSIKNILVEKCNYLKYKIEYRQGIQRNDFSRSKYFIKFYNATNNHYSKVTSGNNGNSTFIDAIGSSYNFDLLTSNSLTVKEIHQLNKYLRRNNSIEVSKKSAKLIPLKSKINLLLQNSSIKKFDKISYLSVKNLLNNTLINLKLKQESDLNFQNLCGPKFYETIITKNEFYEEIRELLNHPYIDYKKYEYVLDFFGDLFEKLQSPESVFTILNDLNNNTLTEQQLNGYKDNLIKNFNSLKEVYKEVLDKKDKNIRYLRRYELKPIYLESKDCIEDVEIEIENQNESIKIFLDSSYILPINFTKITNEVTEKRNEYKTELKLIKSKITNLIDNKISKLKIDKSLKEIEEQKKVFQTNLKDNEFKLVQITAMFVTLAAFILINVKIFDNKTAFESIAIILGLAGVLTLFNGVINWIIMWRIYKSDDRKLKMDTPWFVFILSGTLILISFLILIFSNNETINDKIETTAINISDSIYKCKIDSLQKDKSSKNAIDEMQKLYIEKRIERLEGNR